MISHHLKVASKSFLEKTSDNGFILTVIDRVEFHNVNSVDIKPIVAGQFKAMLISMNIILFEISRANHQIEYSIA